ncbi:MAG: four helix bundle protein [Candidatus Marinimicrobia bacterium]|nr:four helix bundle protein [Candidatus Neomarinimicrobiota bacterium]
MHNYKELQIWQHSGKLVKKIYQITKIFPDTERFSLVTQMQRCAVSIPSNIAKGSGKSSDKVFIRFLEIAISSVFELETQLILANDLEFISENETKIISQKLEEIQIMIFGFEKKLKNQNLSINHES